MTKRSGFFDQAKLGGGELPLPAIIAGLLGVSGAFFCFAMPAAVLDGIFASGGLPVPVGLFGRLLFLILFASVLAAIGWFGMVAVARAEAGISRPAKVKAKRPPAARKSSAKAPRKPAAEPGMTLRRSDAHPDAPPRRPIFAAHDLGTPFDEIVTDPPHATPTLARNATAAEEAPLVFEDPELDQPLPVEAADDAPVAEADIAAETEQSAAAADLDEQVAAALEEDGGKVPSAAGEPLPETEAETIVVPVAEAATSLESEQGFAPETAELIAPHAPVEEEAQRVAAVETAATPPIEAADAELVVQPQPASEAIVVPEAAVAPEPVVVAEPEVMAEPVVVPASAKLPAEERADQSLAALMARFEGGLEKLGSNVPPPPEPATIARLRRPERHPDDALREALEALHRMAARQR